MNLRRLAESGMILNFSLSLAFLCHLLFWSGHPLFSPSQRAPESARGMSLADAVNALREEGALFVDARSPESFASGHIPNAVSAPSYTPIPAVLEKSEAKSKLTIVYCGGPECGASQETAMKLKDAGFTDVRVLEASLEDWGRLGLPIVRENHEN